MPIEIKELHIKVAVTTAPAPAAGTSTGSGSESAREQTQQALVADCVEQVLRILESRAER